MLLIGTGNQQTGLNLTGTDPLTPANAAGEPRILLLTADEPDLILGTEMLLDTAGMFRQFNFFSSLINLDSAAAHTFTIYPFVGTEGKSGWSDIYAFLPTQTIVIPAGKSVALLCYSILVPVIGGATSFGIALSSSNGSDTNVTSNTYSYTDILQTDGGVDVATILGSSPELKADIAAEVASVLTADTTFQEALADYFSLDDEMLDNIAAKILLTPANLLKTDSNGRVDVSMLAGSSANMDVLIQAIFKIAGVKAEYNKSTGQLVVYEEDGVTVSGTYSVSEASGVETRART